MFEGGVVRKDASRFVLCMGRDKGKVNFVDA